MTMAKKESLAKNVKCFSGIRVEEVVKICLLVPPFKLLKILSMINVSYLVFKNTYSFIKTLLNKYSTE